MCQFGDHGQECRLTTPAGLAFHNSQRREPPGFHQIRVQNPQGQRHRAVRRQDDEPRDGADDRVEDSAPINWIWPGIDIGQQERCSLVSLRGGRLDLAYRKCRIDDCGARPNLRGLQLGNERIAYEGDAQSVRSLQRNRQRSEASIEHGPINVGVKGMQLMLDEQGVTTE